jgi:glucose/arabinose dehydrogenase
MLSKPALCTRKPPAKYRRAKAGFIHLRAIFVGKLHQVRVINTGKQQRLTPIQGEKNASHPHSRPACGALALFGSLAQAATELGTQTVATGLEHPWALAFLPDGRYLVTERPGRMRIVEAGGRLNTLSKVFPPSPSPGKAACWMWCWTATLPATASSISASRNRAGSGPGKNSTALAKARLSPTPAPWKTCRFCSASALRSIQPCTGCRIVERKVNGKPDGSLFLTLERALQGQEAQNLQTHLGKIVRVNKDGSVPRDNPFAAQVRCAERDLELWPPQQPGRRTGADDELWMTEHGPQGGDELNRIEPGKNYGWPSLPMAKTYGGGKIGAGITEKGHGATPALLGTVHRHLGLAYLSSERYGVAWKGSFITGALKAMQLQRLQIADGKVTATEVLLPRLGQRVRDVRQGPDGLAVPAHRFIQWAIDARAGNTLSSDQRSTPRLLSQ